MRLRWAGLAGQRRGAPKQSPHSSEWFGNVSIYIDIGMVDKGLKLGAAASAIGVSAITLRRWLLEGKVSEVPRDRNGWRIFMRTDIERIKRYAERLIAPEEKDD